MHATTEAHPHELRLERLFEHPPARLWRCWTEPELLMQWFCPLPWRVTEARLDLRTGGEFYTLMAGPNGERFGEPGVFLAVEPGRRLLFTDAFQPGWRPSSRAFMVGEVLFDDAGTGRTRYLARALHWSAEARQEHEAMGFHEGWGKAADQLDALARTLA